MPRSSLFFLAFVVFVVGSAFARELVPLREWRYLPSNGDSAPNPPAASGGELVRVPHVFRQSGQPDASEGWYFTKVTLPKEPGAASLRLEGAATVVEVWVNGEPVGRHRGAYTAAEFELGTQARWGRENEIALRVDNRDENSRDCLSRSNLFHTPGGLYRPATLVLTGGCRFSPADGASGVYLTPECVARDSASLRIQSVVKNAGSSDAVVRVRHQVLDPEGAVIADVLSDPFTLPPRDEIRRLATVAVSKPRLWAIRQANLYTVRSSLIADGRESDLLEQRTGFRKIELKDGRFYLNGEEVLLRGVNKHHMDEKSWNALGEAELLAEWDGMDALGCNIVRLAHYPHSAFEYDQADRRGIVVWAENGLAGQSWNKLPYEEKTVTPDGERITREMVLQNWNHPSIVIWSSGNETVVDVAAHYAETIRGLDSSRLVTFAANADKPRGCDFDAYNTYDGWYGGNYTGYSSLPKNAYVSETGAGSWSSHHVPYGTVAWKVDVFEPEEYQELFAEYRLQVACKNDAASRPLFLWWNYREFYDTKFKKNRNTKGLITLAGAPKDVWYLFQCFFDEKRPVLRLAGRNHFLRRFAQDNGVKAYGTAESAELFVNGRSQGVRRNGEYRLPPRGPDQEPGIAVDHVFFWNAPLEPGMNRLEVRDSAGRIDSAVVYQAAPDGWVPVSQGSLVVNLVSSNPENRPVFVDRPVRPQSPFYSNVAGDSDNTFDEIPAELEGARWIATERPSSPGKQASLSFEVSRPAVVYVLQSNGGHPLVTLKPTIAALEGAARTQAVALQAEGFERLSDSFVWRDHHLNLVFATLWKKTVPAGALLSVPGAAVDTLVLLKEMP